MGTPTQTEGPSSVDKSHKAILSDVFPTDRDPRSINLPISRDASYQNDIAAAMCYSKFLIRTPPKATALCRLLPFAGGWYGSIAANDDGQLSARSSPASYASM